MVIQMEQDLNQNQLQQEITDLQSQLSEAIAAEGFFNQESGKLIDKLLTKTITKITRDIVSDKYLEDHVGYVNALSELRANRLLQRQLHATASPIRKKAIRERLDHKETVYKEAFKEAEDGAK